MAKVYSLKEKIEKKFEKQYQYDLEHDTFKTLDQRQRDDERHIRNLISDINKEK